MWVPDREARAHDTVFRTKYVPQGGDATITRRSAPRISFDIADSRVLDLHLRATLVAPELRIGTSGWISAIPW